LPDGTVDDAKRVDDKDSTICLVCYSDAVHWATLWLFVLLELPLCLTPGPAVLFVLSSALRSGTRKGVASALGILSGNTIYFVLSGTGVGALLLTSYRLFFAVKWAGAAYLIFLGLRALLRGSSLHQELDKSGPERGSRRLFLDALVVQLSNPKAIVFFSALLPQFIDPHAVVAEQVAILAATSAAIEFCVLLGYSLAAGQASRLARLPRYAVWTNRAAGGFLIGAGTGLAVLKRA